MKKVIGSALPVLLLMLPFLDISLIGMIIRSIADGKPEMGLFVIFCIQIVPQEILIRCLIRLLRKKAVYRWYYWASWICRWALILMAVLSAVHLIQTGSFQTLLVPYVYQSRLWTDLALIPLRWISGLCGLVLTLVRKETRKKVLITVAVGVPLSFFLVGIASSALENEPGISMYVFHAVLLWAPRMLAVVGALFDPLFGKKIREREKAEEAEKAQAARKPVAPTAAPKPGNTGNSPDPAAIEKTLTQQKAAYEQRMRNAKTVPEDSADETADEDMLKRTAYRLFSEGGTAASLGGQRQLVFWMAGAVPALARVKKSPVWKQFYAPQLEDDPQVFLPVLEKLILEVIRILEGREAQTYAPRKADPEKLCAGWYALTRFAAAAQGNRVLAQEADRLKTFFLSDSTCCAWLKETDHSNAGGEEAWTRRP